MSSGPSLWIEAEPERTPALEGDPEVDVAIVGGGYTGLTTALALRREGASVAVIEREFCGFGASGRNAGHLTPTIGKDHPTLLRLYGRERAGALVRLADEAVGRVEELIGEHGIGCEYEPAGNALVAVTDRHARRLEKAGRTAHDLGAEIALLDAAGIAELGLPPIFRCGYHERRGGVLNPGRYVRGLRDAAIDAGAQIFEGTAVEAIEPGRRVTVRAARGAVRADRCVIATNAYTHELGLRRLRSALVRLHVTLFATDPLAPEQLERIGWNGRAGVYTSHELLESWRLTADNRLVGGSRWIRRGYGDRGLPDRDEKIESRLAELFRNRFPQLADARIERFWSGPIGLALDFLPAVGALADDRVVYGIAYAGHGVAMASRMGDALARLALGRDPGIPALTDRRRVPLPPEPLRTALYRAITGTLAAIDRRTDRGA